MLAQLERAKTQYRDAGVRAVAVGMCRPEEAARLCGSRAPSVTCLCDESRAAYAAYGLTVGTFTQVMGPEAVTAGMLAALQGHTMAPAPSADVARMMPGTFAIDADGIIRAAHYARFSGDQPDLGAMLRALR